MQFFGQSSKSFKSTLDELIVEISSIESISITLYFDSTLVLYAFI